MHGFVFHVLSIDIVTGMGGSLGNHHPPGRIDIDELPINSDGTEIALPVNRRPPLIAIAERYLAGSILATRHQIRRIGRYRIMHPLRGHELLPLEVSAFVEIKQPEPRIVAKHSVHTDRRGSLS